MSRKFFYDCKTCAICGITSTKTGKGRSLIELHHIKERHNGGSDDPSNLIPVCSNCHSKIHEESIRLDKWYYSSKGWVMHWYDFTGKEYYGKV